MSSARRLPRARANLLGERGKGTRNSCRRSMRAASRSRPCRSALRRVHRRVVRYLHEREAFGKPLSAYQALDFMVADMDVRAHTARLAYYDAGSRMLADEPFKRQAAIAKLHASNAAVENARWATQIFGGYGFMNEYPVARFWRDSKVLEIGEGTNEVQRMLIARELGLGR